VIALTHTNAVALAVDVGRGLEMVDALAGELGQYHLFHAARADLLRRLGRVPEARQAYREALGLVGAAPERRFLERRLAEVS